MKTRFTLLAIALAVGLGCTRVPEAAEQADLSKRKIRVVATTGMVADLAREIGRERVEVESLMGPGVDPHLYKATSGDVDRLAKADLILYNGLHLEGKMGDVLERAAKDRPVVAVTNALDRSKLLGQPGVPDYHDPHVWFDVALWAQTVKTVEDALVELDPTHEEHYRFGAKSYRIRLENLDGAVRESIATIPKERRVLITSHDAFRYFGRAYDIEVAGLQGISTVVESGLQERATIVELVISRGVKAIFVESSVSPKAIEAVLHDVKERGHAIERGGELFSDAMGGEPGTDTYEGMITTNVATILRALE